MRYILFVCTENSARSQMAEGFFNFYSKNTKYKGISAGTNPTKEVKHLAIEVMQERGINISKQKPKMLTIQMTKDAYKIFTMGCINWCPITPKDVTTDWNFNDPAGKPIEDYRKVRDKIETKIKKLLFKLDDY